MATLETITEPILKDSYYFDKALHEYGYNLTQKYIDKTATLFNGELPIESPLTVDAIMLTMNIAIQHAFKIGYEIGVKAGSIGVLERFEND